MSLTDVMSAAGLHGWAEVGLVISLVAFTAIVVRVARSPREEIDRAARQVLEPDDPPGARRPGDRDAR